MCVGYLKNVFESKQKTTTIQILPATVRSGCQCEKVDPLWLQREIDAESLTRLSACSRLHGPSAPSGRRQPAPTITQRLPRSC